MGNEKINILRLLIESQEKKLSIRKISKIRCINYKSAYNAVKKLEEEKTISIEKIGNTSICSFNRNFNKAVFEAEYNRRERLFKNKDLWLIHKRLSELRFPFIALLFGSYAKGTKTKHSDIDILTIGGDEKKIKTAISLLPLKIHLTHITYDEFIAMAKSKEFTVVSEALKRNIVLLNIEEYYRLLENAE